jgi:hypothetical protein
MSQTSNVFTSTLREPECKDCAATCHICGGSGQHRCQGLHCGGLGYIKIAAHPCMARGCFGRTGVIRRGLYLFTLPWIGRVSIGSQPCKSCGGNAEVVDQQAECTVCHGTKVQKCGNCHGSGVASTGFLGGALPGKVWLGEVDPPRCPACAARQDAQELSILQELKEIYCKPISSGDRVST